MSQSLVKFINRETDDQGNPLSWGRYDLDGAPFRGPVVPTLPESEMETRLARVQEPKNRLFDLSDPDDNKAYLEVWDKIANQWATLIFVERVKVRVRRRLKHEDGSISVEHDVKYKVYVEWSETYMQDGKPMHSQRPYIGRPNE